MLEVFIIILVSFTVLVLLLKMILKKIGNKRFFQVILPIMIIGCLFVSPVVALILFIMLSFWIAIAMLFDSGFVSWLSIFAYCFIFFGFLIPWSCHTDPSKRCASNIECNLWNALNFYAQDNDGYFPDKDGKNGLDMLQTDKYGIEDRFCYCHANGKVPYIYHGGLTTSSASDKVLIEEPSSNHDGYKNVLYCDGKIKLAKDPHYYAFKSSSLIKSLLRLIGCNI